MGAEEVVRAPAELRRTVDGDTYDLLVNWKRRTDWRAAVVTRVRLRDYSARERHDKGPAKPGDARVPGDVALRIADDLLRGSVVHVEMQGTDSQGRDVCWVWRNGESLGEALLAQQAVILGRKEG